MATPKKSVVTVREELRTFDEVLADTTVVNLDKWFTPEFWTMAATAVTNIIAVLALIGWLDRENVESLTKAITAIIAASQVIAVNALLVWKYISSKQAVKTQVVAAKLRLAEDAVYAARFRER